MVKEESWPARIAVPGETGSLLGWTKSEGRRFIMANLKTYHTAILLNPIRSTSNPELHRSYIGRPIFAPLVFMKKDWI